MYLLGSATYNTLQISSNHTCIGGCNDIHCKPDVMMQYLQCYNICWRVKHTIRGVRQVLTRVMFGVFTVHVTISTALGNKTCHTVRWLMNHTAFVTEFLPT